ncbi:major facilitator superfamily protein [Heterostelium album PN500]|uniref:Major facilitator superfamily protein n=1 Tax=Heterostelium pallidum (strain ATCC 26659 / Pp 5 / PN500) TaxID=670386 RepID=D3BP86_HETP5|nr:major facilitator superfamily protein [Heterostelium album PN500]EFA77096.1 major facilitator superfamily protein [Heterostelium album PN500]|eukprot:XP_020429225.1 major facilitator superfamily protein [Heterostelium album PN500]
MGIKEENNNKNRLFVEIATENHLRESITQDDFTFTSCDKDLKSPPQFSENIVINTPTPPGAAEHPIYLSDSSSDSSNSLFSSGSSLEDELEEIDLTHNKSLPSRFIGIKSNSYHQTPVTLANLSNSTNSEQLPPAQIKSSKSILEEQLKKSIEVIVDHLENDGSVGESSMEETSNVDSSPSPSRKSTSFMESTELSQKSILIIFSGLMMSLFLSSLDMTIVATALPAIAEDLGSMDQMSWVITIYLLTSTAISPLFGKFSDIFGKKLTLLFSLVTFLIGSLLCAVSTSMTMLIIVRAIQGIGGGGLMAAVMIVMAEIVPLRQRGKYQGLIGGVYALSSVIGPLVGGSFTDNVNWRWAFWINIPIGVIALVVVFFALKLQQEVIPFRKGIKRVDFIGTLTSVTCIIGFLLALSWGGQVYSWTSPIMIGLFVGTAVFLGVFILNEAKFTNDPIIPLELFTNRNYVLSILTSFFLGFIMFGVIYYIPLYFQIVIGKSATVSGLQLLPTMLGIVAMGAVSGYLITSFGHYKTYPVIGTLFFTVGTFLLSYWTPESTQAEYIGYQIFIGFGIGLTMQVLTMIVQNSVEYKYIAIATATISFFRTIGGVVSVSLFSTILNSQFRSNINHLNLPFSIDTNSFDVQFVHSIEDPVVKAEILNAYSKSLSMVFLVATPFAAMGCLLTFFIKAHKLRTTLHRPDDSNNTSTDSDSTINSTNSITQQNQTEGEPDLKIEIINKTVEQPTITNQDISIDIPIPTVSTTNKITDPQEIIQPKEDTIS